MCLYSYPLYFYLLRHWRENTPCTPGMQQGASTWKAKINRPKVGSADPGVRRPPGGPPRLVLSLSGCLVGPKVASWCSRVFEAV
jgi:hypothetical protein